MPVRSPALQASGVEGEQEEEEGLEEEEGGCVHTNEEWHRYVFSIVFIFSKLTLEDLNYDDMWTCSKTEWEERLVECSLLVRCLTS